MTALPPPLSNAAGGTRAGAVVAEYSDANMESATLTASLAPRGSRELSEGASELVALAALEIATVCLGELLQRGLATATVIVMSVGQCRIRRRGVHGRER